MALTHALSTNNYGICKFIVDSNAALGTHTTLASAMADAASGDTILMRVSVTENVTLTPGVNIVGLVGSEQTPTISITGKLTMTGAGTCTVAGIRLTTNSDFFLAVTGTEASIVKLENCYLNCLNNTGISATSTLGQIFATHCNGNTGTTGIGIFAQSSSTGITMEYCKITNTGSSVTATTYTDTFIAKYCFFAHLFSNSTANGSSSFFYCVFDSSGNNTIFTHNSTNGVASSASWCHFSSGSASAISIGAGSSL